MNPSVPSPHYSASIKEGTEKSERLPTTVRRLIGADRGVVPPKMTRDLIGGVGLAPKSVEHERVLCGRESFTEAQPGRSLDDLSARRSRRSPIAAATRRPALGVPRIRVTPAVATVVVERPPRRTES